MVFNATLTNPDLVRFTLNALNSVHKSLLDLLLACEALCPKSMLRGNTQI